MSKRSCRLRQQISIELGIKLSFSSRRKVHAALWTSVTRAELILLVSIWGYSPLLPPIGDEQRNTSSHTYPHNVSSYEDWLSQVLFLAEYLPNLKDDVGII